MGATQSKRRHDALLGKLVSDHHRRVAKRKLLHEVDVDRTAACVLCYCAREEDTLALRRRPVHL
jgi:hypothetical protein